MIEITRETKETVVKLALEPYGSGIIDIRTGIGFFDHMLNTLTFYAGFNLTINATGDLHVDTHHTAEDVGIVLGNAIYEFMKTKPLVERFASVTIPMDEALVRSVIDLGGRRYLKCELPRLSERLGTFESDTIIPFLDALSSNAWMTLHIDVLDGSNSHHIIEALFKSLGRALKIALSQSNNTSSSIKGDPQISGGAI
ncbi:MAG: imidazoleglycerol-phosphate dehydratase HisB [Bacillota bacterium]|nr:imidazoleglycerol-phosphate dehydratase HisB [Bacillota bacterium]